MIGTTYLERGEPVVVEARWGFPHTGPVAPSIDVSAITRAGPRNVLIRRQDGSRVVRPFRGLRRP